MNLKREQIKGYTISKLNRNLFNYIHIYRMGLSESSLTTITKPFSFLSHCKINCDSPCCQSLW